MNIVKLLVGLKSLVAGRAVPGDFHQISIRGRYIYGFLCLKNVLATKGLPPIPRELNGILIEFVSSDRLDLWDGKATEVQPSTIMDLAIRDSDYKSISPNLVYLLRNYYSNNPPIVSAVVEDLLWIGLSNLYAGFNSKTSIKYIRSIVALLSAESVGLPDFSKVKNCSVNEFRGWGNPTTMSEYE